MWSPLGPGMGGGGQAVYAFEAFDDGSGPALYAGGGFTVAGTKLANHVAKWDGAKWFPLRWRSSEPQQSGREVTDTVGGTTGRARQRPRRFFS